MPARSGNWNGWATTWRRAGRKCGGLTRRGTRLTSQWNPDEVLFEEAASSQSLIREPKRRPVVGAADGSITGLLGGSPGASTAVPAMLDVLQHCFVDRYRSWLPRLNEMVPSLRVELSGEPALFDEVWSWGTKALRSESSRAGVGVVRS